jgi:lysophospholipase L1-like esterase
MSDLVLLAQCLAEAEQRIQKLEKQTPAYRVAAQLRAELQAFAKKLAAIEARDASNEDTRHAFAKRADDIKTAFAAQLSEIHEAIKRKEYAAPKGFNPRGAWDSMQPYAKFDMVSVNGSSFVALVDSPTEKPSRKSNQWMLVAARGGGGGMPGITPSDFGVSLLTASDAAAARLVIDAPSTAALTAETDRATAAEGALSTSLTAETAAREAADEELAEKDLSNAEARDAITARLGLTAFAAAASARIRSDLRSGKQVQILGIGDSLWDGAGGFRIADTFGPAIQSIYGAGGRGYVAFEINQIALEPGIFAGATASTTVIPSAYNPTASGWSVQNTAINTGMFAHVPTGVGTYKTSASNHNFWVRDTVRPFRWVRLYYVEHTGSGSLQFGKTGNLTTINCGGASSVSLKSVTLNIWDGTLPDATFGVVAVSGDVYLAGFETGLYTPSGRVHMGSKGGISAATVAGFNETSYVNWVRGIAPTLCTINLGTNDRSSATPTQLKGYLQTIITRVRTASPGCPILLQLPSNSNYVSVFPTVLSELAAENTDVGVLDWRNVLGDGGTYFLSGGTDVHPNGPGCELLARAMIPALGIIQQNPASLFGYVAPANLPTLITDEARNGKFTASATDWTAFGSSTTVTLDTTNDELDVVANSGGTFRGAQLLAANFTAIQPGARYYILVELTASTGGSLYLSTNTAAIKRIDTGGQYIGLGQTGFDGSGAGIAEYIWEPTAAPTLLGVINETSGGNTFSIKRFEIKRLDSINKTITPAATTGAQTINTLTGSVNFAAAAQTLVITNSLATAQSGCIATVQTDDTTAKSCIATCAAGTITLKLNAAATAETKVFFSLTP